MANDDEPADFAFGVSPSSGALALLLISASGQLACINPFIPLRGEVSGDDARNALASCSDGAAHHAIARALPASRSRGVSSVSVYPRPAYDVLPTCFTLCTSVAPEKKPISFPVIETARCTRTFGVVAVASAKGDVLLYVCVEPLPFEMDEADQEVAYAESGDVLALRGSILPSKEHTGAALHKEHAQCMQLVEVLHLWQQHDVPRAPAGLSLTSNGHHLAVWTGSQLYSASLRWVDSLLSITRSDGDDAEHVGDKGRSRSQGKADEGNCLGERSEICTLLHPFSEHAEFPANRGSAPKVEGACTTQDAVFWVVSGNGLPGAKAFPVADKTNQYNCGEFQTEAGIGPPSPLSPLRSCKGDADAQCEAILPDWFKHCGLETLSSHALDAAKKKLHGSTLDTGNGRRELASAAVTLGYVYKQNAKAAESHIRWGLQRLGEELERQARDAKEVETKLQDAQTAQKRLQERVSQLCRTNAEHMQRLQELAEKERPLSHLEEAAEAELEQRELELDVLEEQLESLWKRVYPQVHKWVGHAIRGAPLPAEQSERIRQELTHLQGRVDGIVQRTHSATSPLSTQLSVV